MGGVKFLPIKGTAADRTAKYVIDGALYTLRFRWSKRSESWFVEIYDSADTLLAGAVRMVPGRILWPRRTNTAMPAGVLFVYDSAEDNEAPPGLDDLTGRVEVVHIVAGDLTAEETDPRLLTVASVVVS